MKTVKLFEITQAGQRTLAKAKGKTTLETLQVKHPQASIRELWRVTYPANGKTVRRFFDSEQAATLHANETTQEQKQMGHAWQGLNEEDRIALLQCFQRAQKRGYTIEQACTAFETSGSNLVKEQLTLQQAITKFENAHAWGQKFGDNYVKMVRADIDLFVTGRESLPLCSVTAQLVREHVSSQAQLKAWGDFRKQAAVKHLKVFTSILHRENYLRHDPLVDLKKPTAKTTITILTVDQAIRALNLTLQPEWSDCRAWLAVSLFACVRQSDLIGGKDGIALPWQNIREEIEVQVSKSDNRRLLTIHPTLKAWLDTCRPLDPASLLCSVAPSRLVAFRKVAGLSRNILRHSAISYWIGRTHDIAATSLEADNSPQIIKQHYLKRVTQTDADRFWQLTPQALTLHSQAA